jgi:hypothetical protein
LANKERLCNRKKTSHPQTSSRKIEANQANAARSAGPVTDAGKAKVAQNAVRHGLCGKTLRFESDDEKEEFQQILAELIDEYNPEGISDNMLVHEIAVSWWKVQVAERLTMREFSSGKKAVDEILTACSDISGIAATGARSSLACTGLLVSVGRKTPDFAHMDIVGGKPQLEFVAKLASSAEPLIRYQIAWKRDFFRAMQTLRNSSNPA